MAPFRVEVSGTWRDLALSTDEACTEVYLVAAPGLGAKPRSLRRRVQRDKPCEFREPDRRSTLDRFPEPDRSACRRRTHDGSDRCAHAVLTPLVESRMRLMIR